MNQRIVLTLLFVFILTCPGYAKTPEVASQLQKKYASVATFSVDFTQNIIHSQSGAKEERTGTLTFKKPFLFLWQCEKPTKESIIINDTFVWNVFADEEMAYKYPLSTVQQTYSIFNVITGTARLDQNFDIESAKEEKGIVALQLFPKEPTQNMIEVWLWVDAQTALIQKLLIIDFFGNRNTITFSKHVLNKDITEKVFSFTPPKNMLIEDRTKDPQQMHKELLQ